MFQSVVQTGTKSQMYVCHSLRVNLLSMQFKKLFAKILVMVLSKTTQASHVIINTVLTNFATEPSGLLLSITRSSTSTCLAAPTTV